MHIFVQLNRKGTNTFKKKIVLCEVDSEIRLMLYGSQYIVYVGLFLFAFDLRGKVATPGNAQNLLLVLKSGITLGEYTEPYVFPGTEPVLAVFKASALPTIPPS